MEPPRDASPRIHYATPAMMIAPDDKDELVPLDDETALWLVRLSQVTGTPRGRLVASILRDIRVDDEVAEGAAAPEGATIN